MNPKKMEEWTMKNKNYRQLLSDHIQRSGLTLRQIAQQCKELNHPIDPSYISKLQNGHLPPPAEGVSYVLAEVLGASAEELIYLGYIEKAPTSIRQRLWDQYLSSDFFSWAKRISNLPPRFRQKIMDEVEWLEELNKRAGLKI